MQYYFVDYENVNCDGLAGLEKIEKESNIFIMYSEKCKSISLDIIEKAEYNGIKIIPHKVTCRGKNALDFQLSSLLGYVIGKKENESDNEYIIISKDAGYDALVNFWRKRNIKVRRYLNLGKINEEQKEQNVQKADTKNASGKTKTTTKEEILKYLSEEEYSIELLNIVNGSKTKMEINNRLLKLFKDGKKAGAIYKKLKTLLKEKSKK